jgi:RecB family exonuclease
MVLQSSEPTFAGRILKREPVAFVPPLDPRAEWVAAAGEVQPREFESASSLESLLTCPLQWTLKYASGLRPSIRQSVPNTENLIGSLIHRIAQEIFLSGDPPAPEATESFASRRFDELLPQIAAPLLLPGAAAELAAARRSAPPALAELARFLRSENLAVVGVESKFSEPDTLADGFGVEGRIDMLAVTASGRSVVVDLKWYRTDKYVRDDIKNGTAFQIAVYAKHVADEKADAAAGYFMLRQRRFVSSTPISGGDAMVVAGPAPKETWESILASFGPTVEEMAKGTIRATFEHKDTKQAEFSDHCLLAPPKCKFCDYDGICGAAS